MVEVRRVGPRVWVGVDVWSGARVSVVAGGRVAAVAAVEVALAELLAGVDGSGC